MLSDFAPMSEQEFAFFSGLIHQLAGIVIPEDKISMLQGRVNKRLRALNLTSYSEYQQVLSKRVSRDKELQQFINVLTTNKTEFFREKTHFHFLEESIKKRRLSGTIYIWCAATSTGEEVYSLAMTCEELIEQGYMENYRILGTDIDTQCLRQAQHGVYNKEDMGQVPPMFLQKYFKLYRQGTSELEARNFIKNKLKFRQYNLKEPPGDFDMQFDYIFVRNVLFYFSKETSADIVNRLTNFLVPGGYLFVSLTESLSSLPIKLAHVSNSVYQNR